VSVQICCVTWHKRENIYNVITGNKLMLINVTYIPVINEDA
jgi:hypothetical protein